jgi:hypothetical protein
LLFHLSLSQIKPSNTHENTRLFDTSGRDCDSGTSVCNHTRTEELLVDAAKQIFSLQDTLTVKLTDSFISTVNDKETREQLLKLKAMGEVSTSVAENAQLIEDLYEKKKIKLDPKCAIIGAI